MLSEILFAAAPVQQKEKQEPARPPGLSGSGLFPCPYRLYKVQKGDVWRDEITPQQYYNMNDGWDQEEQSVRRLARAGIVIENRQARVTVGKSKIPGSIDGAYTLNSKKRLWEHKAWKNDNFYAFSRWGLNIFPGEKAQVNAYMLGMGLDEVDFFVKAKESNDYFDAIYHLDEDFILPIIEWADKIRLYNWIPEPKECEWCSRCGVGCFDEVIDLSWIGTADPGEMEEKWKLGDKYVKVGEMMKEEARTFFVGKTDKYGSVLVEGIIGDKEILRVGDLEIRKIVQHRFDIKREKILEYFGPEGLVKVGEDREIVAYRIREVS